MKFKISWASRAHSTKRHEGTQPIDGFELEGTWLPAFTRMEWHIEIGSIDDLMRLKDKEGSLVISDYDGDQPEIIVYDDYLE